MGKALYREHRPLSLSDVKGQSHITDTLEHAIKKGAISHAYLFTGPRGVGKTSVARILAHRINDLEYTDDATHLDIIEIDAASNRRIDEIRDLRDKVHIAPTSSKYKVYIIDEDHMLTREAFNALLKTLEEPPEHAVFILATTEAHKVPDTIISRSQQFSFRPVVADEAIKHLRSIADKEKMSIDDDALALLAQHGNGSFRDSISMLDQLTGFDLETITAKDVASLLGVPNSDTLELIIDAMTTNNVSKLFDTIQTLRETGTNPSKVAQSLISLLRKKLSSSSASPYNWSVQLMKDLLPITAGNATFETLEVTLLGAITIHENQTITAPRQPVAEEAISEPTEVVKELPSEVYAKPVSSPAEDTKPSLEIKTQSVTSGEEIKKNVEAKPISSNDAKNSWESVLELLKGKHNTLYGVLRMATVNEDETSLTLQFQFDFHKKKLTEGKNMKALQDIVTKVYKSPREIKTEVKKNSAQITADKIPANNDAPLENISNIFGSAELLD